MEEEISHKAEKTYIYFLSVKAKLLIFEIKEKFPHLSPEEITDILCINTRSVERLFQQGEIIIPSKMNKKCKRKRKSLPKKIITSKKVE